MSCGYARGVRLLSVLTGIPVGRMGSIVDVARKHSHLPITLSPHAERLIDYLPSVHGMTAMHDIVRGLVLVARRQPPPHDLRPVYHRIVAVTHALIANGAALGIPPVAESLAAQVCNDIAALPTPAPLPPSVDAGSRIVPHLIAAAIHGSLSPSALNDWVRHARLTATDYARLLSARILSWSDLDDAWKGSPWLIAELIRRGWDDDHWRSMASTHGAIASALLCFRRDMRGDPILRQSAAREPRDAAQVLIHCPELRTDPELIASVARSATAAAEVLIHCPELRENQHLIRRIARNRASAIHVVRTVPAMRQHRDLLAAIRSDAGTVRDLLMQDVSLWEQDVLMESPHYPQALAEALVAHPEARTAERVARSAKHWDAAATLVCAYPDLRTDPELIASVARSATAAAEVLIHCPELRQHPYLRQRVAANAPAAVVKVLTQCPPLRDDPILWAGLAGETKEITALLRHAPYLHDHPLLWRLLDGALDDDVRALNPLRWNQWCELAPADRMLPLLDTLGPFPALWQRLPVTVRQEWIARRRIPPAIADWIDVRARATAPASWSPADTRIARRHPATRTLLTWYATASAAPSHGDQPAETQQCDVQP